MSAARTAAERLFLHDEESFSHIASPTLRKPERNIQACDQVLEAISLRLQATLPTALHAGRLIQTLTDLLRLALLEPRPCTAGLALKAAQILGSLSPCTCACFADSDLKEIVTLIEDASWQQIPASAAPAVSDSAAPAAHPWDVLGCLLDCVRCVLEARPQPSDPSSPGALPAEEWGEVVAIACVASLRLLVPLPFDMGYAGGDRAETISAAASCLLEVVARGPLVGSFRGGISAALARELSPSTDTSPSLVEQPATNLLQRLTVRLTAGVSRARSAAGAAASEPQPSPAAASSCTEDVLCGALALDHVLQLAHGLPADGLQRLLLGGAPGHMPGGTSGALGDRGAGISTRSAADHVRIDSMGLLYPITDLLTAAARPGCEPTAAVAAAELGVRLASSLSSVAPEALFRGGGRALYAALFPVICQALRSGDNTASQMSDDASLYDRSVRAWHQLAQSVLSAYARVGRNQSPAVPHPTLDGATWALTVAWPILTAAFASPPPEALLSALTSGLPKSSPAVQDAFRKLLGPELSAARRRIAQGSPREAGDGPTCVSPELVGCAARVLAGSCGAAARAVRVLWREGPGAPAAGVQQGKGKTPASDAPSVLSASVDLLTSLTLLLPPSHVGGTTSTALPPLLSALSDVATLLAELACAADARADKMEKAMPRPTKPSPPPGPSGSQPSPDGPQLSDREKQGQARCAAPSRSPSSGPSDPAPSHPYWRFYDRIVESLTGLGSSVSPDSDSQHVVWQAVGAVLQRVARAVQGGSDAAGAARRIPGAAAGHPACQVLLEALTDACFLREGVSPSEPESGRPQDAHAAEPSSAECRCGPSGSQPGCASRPPQLHLGQASLQLPSRARAELWLSTWAWLLDSCGAEALDLLRIGDLRDRADVDDTAVDLAYAGLLPLLPDSLIEAAVWEDTDDVSTHLISLIAFPAFSAGRGGRPGRSREGVWRAWRAFVDRCMHLTEQSEAPDACYHLALALQQALCAALMGRARQSDVLGEEEREALSHMLHVLTGTASDILHHELAPEHGTSAHATPGTSCLTDIASLVRLSLEGAVRQGSEAEAVAALMSARALLTALRDSMPRGTGTAGLVLTALGVAREICGAWGPVVSDTGDEDPCEPRAVSLSDIPLYQLLTGTGPSVLGGKRLEPRPATSNHVLDCACALAEAAASLAPSLVVAGRTSFHLTFAGLVAAAPHLGDWRFRASCLDLWERHLRPKEPRTPTPLPSPSVPHRTLDPAEDPAAAAKGPERPPPYQAWAAAPAMAATLKDASREGFWEARAPPRPPSPHGVAAPISASDILPDAAAWKGAIEGAGDELEASVARSALGTWYRGQLSRALSGPNSNQGSDAPGRSVRMAASHEGKKPSGLATAARRGLFSSGAGSVWPAGAPRISVRDPRAARLREQVLQRQQALEKSKALAPRARLPSRQPSASNPQRAASKPAAARGRQVLQGALKPKKGGRAHGQGRRRVAPQAAAGGAMPLDDSPPDTSVSVVLDIESDDSDPSDSSSSDSELSLEVILEVEEEGEGAQGQEKAAAKDREDEDWVPSGEEEEEEEEGEEAEAGPSPRRPLEARPAKSPSLPADGRNRAASEGQDGSAPAREASREAGKPGPRPKKRSRDASGDGAGAKRVCGLPANRPLPKVSQVLNGASSIRLPIPPMPSRIVPKAPAAAPDAATAAPAQPRPPPAARGQNEEPKAQPKAQPTAPSLAYAAPAAASVPAPPRPIPIGPPPSAPGCPPLGNTCALCRRGSAALGMGLNILVRCGGCGARYHVACARAKPAAAAAGASAGAGGIGGGQGGRVATAGGASGAWVGPCCKV